MLSNDQKSNIIQQIGCYYLNMSHYSSTLFTPHQQETNLLKSSLEVLLELVTGFMDSHQISYQPSTIKQDDMISLQDLFQQIYIKVKAIFSWSQSQNCKAIKKSQSSSSIQIVSGNNQEELYQLLNQYKKSNKILRRELQDTKNQLNKLMQQNKKIKEQSQQFSGQLHQKLQFLKSQSEEMIDRIQLLNAQLEQKSCDLEKEVVKLEQKQKEAKLLSKTIQELQLKNMELLKHVEESESNLVNLSDIHQNEIAKSQRKYQELYAAIPKIIEEKLRQKENWEIPAYKGLLGLMKKYEGKCKK